MRNIKPIISIFFFTFLAANNSAALNIQAGIVSNYAVGDLSERVEYGIGGKAGVGITLSEANSGNIDLVLVSQYLKFPTSIENDGDYSFLTLGVDLRLSYLQQNNSVLYLVIGGGYGRVERDSFIRKVTTTGTLTTEFEISTFTENDFYVSPGIGVVFSNDSGIQPFLELRFTDIAGTVIKDMQFFQLELGIRF